VLERGWLVDAVDGDVDCVVHPATKIPTDRNPDEEDWALNDRIRREGTENLIAATEAADADRFVLQSVAWVARQPDGSPFDESAEPNPDRSTESALDAERILADAAKEGGFESVALRGGWFYAHDTAHTRMYGEGLLDRSIPIIGRGLLGRRDATLSFVHVDDVARAFADAVEGEATGTFHVVDDEPTTYADFVQSFAARLGAPSPRRVPAWLARFLVDDNLVRLLTCPMPTTNERFREAFDWSPEYPSVEAELDSVVEQWRADGPLRENRGGYEWTDV
jgi:nucleoside-diphosphate-sugar epimerase